MLRRVVWYQFTDVSEVLTASIIRAMICTENRGSSGTVEDVSYSKIVMIILAMISVTTARKCKKTANVITASTLSYQCGC
jgi:hypothetical protein